jgi:hypothetical protein
MSKRKNLQVVFPLKSEEEFLKAVADSDRYLTVVDIHQTWSGPCSVMEPLYRKAFIELEQPEQRLKCYTIEAEKLSPQSRTGLPVNDSCKPLFVVYKVGAGALFFLLVVAVTALLPPVDARFCVSVSTLFLSWLPTLFSNPSL